MARGAPTVAAVVSALDSDTAVVRWQAAWILGRIKSPASTAALLGALERGSADVRVESAVGLVRTGGNASVGGLVRLLASRDPPVREEAAWASATSASRRLPSRSFRRSLTPTRAGWRPLRSESWARQAAAPLAAALQSPTARMRRAEPGHWRDSDPPQRPPVLLRSLGDPDEEVRYWAAQALRGTGTPEASRAAAVARPTRWDRDARRCAPPRSAATIASGKPSFSDRRYRLYPETLDEAPAIPSPLTTTDGTELMVAVTSDGKHAIVPVTLKASERQCDADAGDFPTLAGSGRHSEIELDLHANDHRPIGRRNRRIRPSGLSSDDGFLEVGEDVISILKDDNDTVTARASPTPSWRGRCSTSGT